MRFLSKIKIYLFRIIYLLSCISIRSKKIWVYGAWNGELYADNSKYLFQYANKLNDDITHVWISKSAEAVEHIRKQGFKAYKKASFGAFWYSLRAKVVFVTAAESDLIPQLIGGATVIQLWHGYGLKDTRNWNIKGDFNHPFWMYDKLIGSHKKDIWMVCCEDAIKKYNVLYGVSPDRIYITGLPKDDAFVNQRNNKFISEIREEHPDCKIAVYLPTHRNFGIEKKNNLMSVDSLIELDKMLGENNIVMIFKPHFHELKNYQNMEASFSNIILAFDKLTFGDVYEFLPSCDVLISDYSSIMYGFLATDKPIILFPYDLEEYLRNDAGCYYNYEDVAPGPLCYTWYDVVKELNRSFIRDKYKEQREKVRKLMNPFRDGHNCERVYTTVCNIIK